MTTMSTHYELAYDALLEAGGPLLWQRVAD
jgi:hypothetical protein